MSQEEQDPKIEQENNPDRASKILQNYHSYMYLGEKKHDADDDDIDSDDDQAGGGKRFISIDGSFY